MSLGAFRAGERVAELAALPEYLRDAITGDELATRLFMTQGLDALRGAKFDALLDRYEAEQAERRLRRERYEADVANASRDLQVVLGDRASGKTTAVVAWLREGVTDADGNPSRVVMVADIARAQHICRVHGIPASWVLVAGEDHRRRLGRPEAAVAVDDLRDVLAVLLRVRVGLVSDFSREVEALVR